MRSPRIKEAGSGYYHIISRVVDRRMVLTDIEKEHFSRLMRSVARFSGCQVLAYTVMTNHWHILLYVPETEALDDDKLLARLRALYSTDQMQEIACELRNYRRLGDADAAERLRQRYLVRMYDVSEFAKTLKQRFTQAFNLRHGRKGTLWEERFKSVLLEGNPATLATIAAYIDLNPVRAGIVKDPKDYRFCSYGAAVAGARGARRGLCRVVAGLGAALQWSQTAAEYRKLLYAAGAPKVLGPDGRPVRRGFTEKQVAAVEKVAGELSKATLLRCRVRYFTDGAILGSRIFVNEAFQRHRAHFSRSRQTGARPMKGQWDGLCSARRLRLAVITPPQVT